jgi:cytidine deaminase
MSNIYTQLKDLVSSAYAPYSKFKVAAIVVTDQGLFSGVNVENNSYSLSVCAERVAIFNAILHHAHQFKAIYIYTDSRNVLPLPCGACLQVMQEFFDLKTTITICNASGRKHTYKLRDLLPHKFNMKPRNT